MSSLAPLSFSCCDELVTKMSLKQKRKLYDSILSSIDECDMYMFSLIYQKHPRICNSCNTKYYKIGGGSCKMCTTCWQHICQNCYVICTQNDVYDIYCFKCATDNENDDLHENECDCDDNTYIWTCSSCNKTYCAISKVQYKSSHNHNPRCRECFLQK